MAWPIPHVPLDTNKVNSLAQINDHPDHHNDMADAINNITTETGVVRNRVTAVEGALPGKASTSSVTAVQNNVNAVAADLAEHENDTTGRTTHTMSVSQRINGTNYTASYQAWSFSRHGIIYIATSGLGSVPSGGWPGGGITTQEEVRISFSPATPYTGYRAPAGLITWRNQSNPSPQAGVIMRGTAGNEFFIVRPDGAYGYYGGGSGDMVLAGTTVTLELQIQIWIP